MFRSTVLALVLFAAVTACGPAPTTADGGIDAGIVPDAGSQSTNDAGIDAGFDAGTSVGDAGVDAGVDAGMTCSPSNCLGCCDGNTCVLTFNQSAAQCGSAGLTCGSCANGESCSGGICAAPTNGPCDINNCDGCCLSSTQCVRFTAQSASTCGNNGASCGACSSGATCSYGACQGGTACNATTCNGCCDGNTCVTLANETAARCGASASSCTSCNAAETCSAGQCVNQNQAACLLISPNEHDFRSVQLSCHSPTKTFTIWNHCSQSVDIFSIGIVGPGAANFSLTNGNGMPFTLAGNYAKTTFQVQYAPSSGKADEATLALNSNESAVATSYRVPLFGSGAATGENTDTFAVPTKADALFVIDDSNGMDTYQLAFKDNWAGFFDYAFRSGVDFQLAATTTGDDTFSAHAQFISSLTHPAILTATTPYLKLKYGNKMMQGGNGSVIETGLNPAREALTPPLSTSTNAGFLRNGASLGVAVLTDAPDQTPVPWAFNLASLQALKGGRRPNDFSFSVVGPFATVIPSTCSGYDTGPDTGGYAAVVSATAGAKEEICTTNWPATVSNVGRALFGLRYTWFLLATPDLSGSNTLTVSVNGNSLTTGWSYDAATNSVTFDPAFAPRAGQTVTFTYSRACIP